MNNSMLGGRSGAEQQYPQTTSCAAIEANAAAKIDRALDSAEALATRAQALADVICGRGSLAGNEKARDPVPSPDGVLPRLAARAVNLQDVMNETHAALYRIERELT